MAAQLHNGLEQQIEQFLSDHPNTGLIVIDTLQRIRGGGDSGNPYANDYRDIGSLKALADKRDAAASMLTSLHPGGGKIVLLSAFWV